MRSDDFSRATLHHSLQNCHTLSHNRLLNRSLPSLNELALNDQKNSFSSLSSINPSSVSSSINPSSLSSLSSSSIASIASIGESIQSSSSSSASSSALLSNYCFMDIGLHQNHLGNGSNNNSNNNNNNNANNAQTMKQQNTSPLLVSTQLKAVEANTRLNQTNQSQNTTQNQIQNQSLSQSQNLSTNLNTNPTLKRKRKSAQNCNCPLCIREYLPPCLNQAPTWLQIIRIAFWCLTNLHPTIKYFSLRDQVYPFLETHWDILCPSKRRKDNWKKSLQDTLSHADCLESGKEIFGQNGYWALRELRDPWNDHNGSFSASGKPKGRPPKIREEIRSQSVTMTNIVANDLAARSELRSPPILPSPSFPACEPNTLSNTSASTASTSMVSLQNLFQFSQNSSPQPYLQISPPQFMNLRSSYNDTPIPSPEPPPLSYQLQLFTPQLFHDLHFKQLRNQTKSFSANSLNDRINSANDRIMNDRINNDRINTQMLLSVEVESAAKLLASFGAMKNDEK